MGKSPRILIQTACSCGWETKTETPFMNVSRFVWAVHNLLAHRRWVWPPRYPEF